MDEINFRIIRKNSEVQIKMLYELLKFRNFNISHEKLPDFDSHKKFVVNNSYRTWNIIERNNKTLGTFYITFDKYAILKLKQSGFKTKVKGNFIYKSKNREIIANLKSNFDRKGFLNFKFNTKLNKDFLRLG